MNYQDNIYKIYSTLSYVINKKAARKLISKIYKNSVYYLDPEIKHVADSYLYKKLVTYVYKTPYFTYPAILT